MKRSSTIVLQVVTVLIAVVAIFLLIRFPLTEGRAANLDLFSIYTDPLILFGYISSVPFFVGLYKAFRILGYIGQNNAFSISVVKALRSIQKCALILSLFIVLTGIYIVITHNKEDDPAGFIALCIITTFASLVVATAFSVFEKIVQNGLDLKSENEQLVNQIKK